MPDALKDLAFWKKSGQVAVQNKITRLLDDIAVHPYTGIGKPEALKGDLSGIWSRRIDDKNRILYEQDSDVIVIYSMKGHYFDK